MAFLVVLIRYLRIKLALYGMKKDLDYIERELSKRKQGDNMRNNDDWARQ